MEVKTYPVLGIKMPDERYFFTLNAAISLQNKKAI